MTTDREVLEAAAKAAGVEALGVSFKMNGSFAGFPVAGKKVWSPLTDDGDSLRLVVKLKLEIYIHETDTRCIGANLNSAFEYHNSDPYAATRRAITRAAAEIGKGMK